MTKESLIKYWQESNLIKNKRLIEAFREIPREKFVLEEYIERAYLDAPLPILKGKTISQPTTVMIMLDAHKLKKTDVVLEIGSGSGYNSALLSNLVKHVYSIEYIQELADFAKENLKKLNIKNVTIIHGDGSQGYREKALYDKIIITAACPRIPQPLIEQLKENGIVVAPVGPRYEQKLVKGIKKKGKLLMRELGGFMFVPLKGKYSYQIETN